MRELRRTTDPVYLSAAEALLRAAGLNPVILDQTISVMEGSINAFPRRLMIADADAARALALLNALDRDAARA